MTKVFNFILGCVSLAGMVLALILFACLAVIVEWFERHGKPI